MRKYLLIFSIFLLTSCNTFTVSEKPQTVQKIDSKIESVDSIILETEKKKDEEIQKIKESVQKQTQIASASVYEAKTANTLNPDKNLHTVATGKALDIAEMNLPKPSPEDILKANERLKLALNEATAKSEELQKLYDQSYSETIVLKNNIITLEKNISELEIQMKDKLKEKDKLIAQKETEYLKELTNKDLKIKDLVDATALKMKQQELDAKNAADMLMIKMIVGLASFFILAGTGITIASFYLNLPKWIGPVVIGMGFISLGFIKLLNTLIFIIGLGVIVLLSIVLGIVFIAKTIISGKSLKDVLSKKEKQIKEIVEGGETFKTDLVDQIDDILKLSNNDPRKMLDEIKYLFKVSHERKQSSDTQEIISSKKT